MLYRTPSATYFRWMHPSYRDLVIEELSQDVLLRDRFLANMSLAGIKLAVSEAGGASGQRHLPLMGSSRSWELLHDRCVELAAHATDDDVEELLTALTTARTSALKEPQSPTLASTLQHCLGIVRARWSSTALKASQIRAYASATLAVDALTPLPDLDATWKLVHSAPTDAEREHANGYALNADKLQLWAEVTEAIASNEPRFFRRLEIAPDLETSTEALQKLADSFVASFQIPDTSDDARQTASAYRALAAALDAAADARPHAFGIPLDVSDKVETAQRYADELDDAAREMDPPEPDGPEYDVNDSRQTDDVDVVEIFSDF